MLANTVLIGAALQLGGLPVSLENVERALQHELGPAAAATREAILWGRWTVHDPEAVERCLDQAEQGGAHGVNVFDPSERALRRAGRAVADRNLPADLSGLITRRAAQVVDYQDSALANRFLDLVEEAARADSATEGWAVTLAVAESWFKLLTYKDEYEVARLHLALDHRRIAADLGIEGDYEVRYHLHPPVLRRIGLKQKLPMGKTYEMAFRVLRPMKRLRGTPFDIFGWDRDRRMERSLVQEYAALVDDLVVGSPGLAYETKLAAAGSAMSIKGFGPVKEAAVDRWRSEVAELRRASGEAVQPVAR
jgi:indolepyruvate ferredoxin oxidoreductase